MAKKKSLTPLQRRFVNEYLVDLNATEAAKRAGYSEKTAYSQGQRLLKKVEVQNAVQAGQKNRERRTEITQDRVLEELAAIGFARGTDYADIEGGYVTLNDTGNLTEQQKAAVVSIESGRSGTKVKLADKVKALELLGKHLGLFNGGGAEAPEAEDDPLTTSIKETLKNGAIE